MQIALLAKEAGLAEEKVFDLSLEVTNGQDSLLNFRQVQINSLISEVDLWKQRYENSQTLYKKERIRKRKWGFTAIGLGFLALFLTFAPN